MSVFLNKLDSDHQFHSQHILKNQQHFTKASLTKAASSSNLSCRVSEVYEGMLQGS